MSMINQRVCQFAGILTIFMTISATATVVLGFVNLGTFHTTEVKTTVGIWCGLVMFLHIFCGLMMMGTRNKIVGGLYFLVSLGCLGVCVAAIVFSEEYYNDFKMFADYNRQATANTFCDESKVDGQCSCFMNGKIQLMKGGFQFQMCPLIHFGEDLWLCIILMSAVNALFALIGASLIGFTAIVTNQGKN